MFDIFILKLTSFCNLNCSYCYMFNSKDQSYAHKPRYMSPEVAIRTLHAIDAHFANRELKSAAIVLHGGEPTLWPLESFREFLDEVSRLRRNGLALSVSMQTNLWQRPRPELLELCLAHEMRLGVSLDGPKTANDANRQDFAGHGSYDRIMANARWLVENGFEKLILGFLCVMQPSIDPAAFVAWVASLPVTRVDLLWPLEFNRANPPWQTGSEALYAREPRHGKWAEAVFEEWWRIDRPDLQVRLFADTLDARLGGGRATDVMGALSFQSLVINTDGAIELADYFRTAKDSGSATPYSVLAHDFDAVARDERVARLKRAAETPPEPCRRCDHLGYCRGGTLSGRLDDRGDVTANASVMCHDHMRFFDTVAKRVGEELGITG